MASPAPIAPPQLPASPSAPGNAPPAKGGDDDAVSFDAVLAAALAVPSGASVDPLATASAPADAGQPEAKPADATQNTDLPAQVLDGAAAAQVVVAAQMAVPVAPASGTPAIAVDGLAPAKPAVADPGVVPAATATRADAAPASPSSVPALPLSVKGPLVPDPAGPDPASIAAPTLAAMRPTADPAPVSALAESSPKPDSATTPHHDSNTPTNVVPIASERVDSAARPSAQPVRLEMAAPVGSREFGTEMGSRLVWMATNNHQVAELRIDPPQLGPVEVRLSIANDQASLSFASPHAAVRDAIQASLPRLQDMLQGLGISLGNVSVGAESFAQGNPDHSALAQGWAGAEHALADPAYLLHPGTAAGVVPLRAGLGVIDVYA